MGRYAKSVTPEERRERARRRKATVLARATLFKAVRAGRILPGPCPCGSHQDILAEFPDVRKPLKPSWVCRACWNRKHGVKGPWINVNLDARPEVIQAALDYNWEVSKLMRDGI